MKGHKRVTDDQRYLEEKLAAIARLGGSIQDLKHKILILKNSSRELRTESQHVISLCKQDLVGDLKKPG